MRLVGFDSIVGRDIQPDRRLGTEFADYARRQGAGGIFHTDELPGYGITEAEVEQLRSTVGATEDDAVALVAAEPETAKLAIEAVAERAAAAIEGVPEETRAAEEDGTSRYLRPLPGAARMYPETDVPPVELDASEVEEPELLTERVERYEHKLDLDAALAEQVAYGAHMTTFEAAVSNGVDPNLAARTLEGTLTELRRDDVPIERLGSDDILGVFELVDAGDIAKEGITDVLRVLANNPSLTIDAAVTEAGIESADSEDVREVIVEVVERNEGQVAEEGMAAFSGLMGECMGALRGRADGEIVSEYLREEIQKRAD